MERKVKEEQRVFDSLNSGIEFNSFHKYEQEAILKAMQEYADLRCKPLVEALEKIREVTENLPTHNIAVKALFDYNQNK